jgi:hypothetical protein
MGRIEATSRSSPRARSSLEAIMPGPCRRRISPSLRSHQQCAATEFTMTTWPGRPYPCIGSHQHGRGFQREQGRRSRPGRTALDRCRGARRAHASPCLHGPVRGARSRPYEPLAGTLASGPPGLPCHRDKCAIEDQSTRVGRRMEGVRRPPDQTCDRCGPAVRAAYGATASSISAALREPVLAWLAGEDVLAPQPAEGNRHDR